MWLTKLVKSSHGATADIRVYLGHDREKNKCRYHNRTIHGPVREAQAYPTERLSERDLEGAQIEIEIGAGRFRVFF